MSSTSTAPENKNRLWRGTEMACSTHWASEGMTRPIGAASLPGLLLCQMPHLIPCSATLIGIHFLSDLQMKRTYAQITEETCPSPQHLVAKRNQDLSSEPAGTKTHPHSRFRHASCSGVQVQPAVPSCGPGGKHHHGVRVLWIPRASFFFPSKF